MSYKLTTFGIIIRKSDGAFIPKDEGNSDFKAYLSWLSEGNIPEDADADTVAIPSSCTRRQGRLSLLNAGKLDAVEAVIEAISDPITKRQAKIEYEADTWERSNSFLQSMWSALGGTAEELDALFSLAVTL